MEASSSVDWFFVVQTLIPVCALTFVYYTIRAKTPPIHTQGAAQEVILRLIKEHLAQQPSPHEKIRIYDLGSGFGGLGLAVAKAFPEAEVVGYELAWPYWLVSCLRRVAQKQKNAHFYLGDFWKKDISDGDIILVYLRDVVMNELSDKLRREARPRRLVITNTFPLPADWTPFARIPIAAAVSKEVIVYRQQ